MNKLNLPKLITRTNSTKLVLPLLFLFILAFIYVHTPIKDYVNRQTVNSPSEAMEVLDTTDYVKITLNDLYFTGVTQEKDDKVIAYYYYTLYEERCYYALISARLLGDIPTEYIDSLTCVARLDRDSQMVNRLSYYMGESLGWNALSLVKISSDVIINQSHMQNNAEFIYIIFFGLCALMAILHVLVVLVSLVCPRLSRSVLWLKRFHDPDMYTKACIQFANATPIAPSFYITEDFFISFDLANIYIIPLEHIVWAYIYGTLNTRLFSSTLVYNFCVVTDDKHHFVLKRKKKDAAEYVLNTLQTRFPEIMIGYGEGKNR